ncbi:MULTISPECIES: flavocytochrome c [Campylobacter]|uniref:flavocytochrome c n=1 Tax=Campylobacter TaxID=194 RepID=UPI00027A35B4|nr:MULTISPECIES: flavocytochrome c [Campylobacter]EJP74811.1 flavocytochrome c [Campylobacter sp. FOBRC14]QKF61841.1 flavocytochrome c [Campylobacter curvus]UEB50131.1 flavocytochrome c [Campylobacter curvus]
MSSISRRNFVKMSVAGAGMLALSGLDTQAALNQKDVKFDEEFDVVIVGSGFAGLAAAISAAKRGKNVLVVEKMGRVGGNSVINGGQIAVHNNDLQKRDGIKDSKELFVKDILSAGKVNHPSLVNVLVDRDMDTFKFAVENGAKFSDKLYFAGGHSVARSYHTENESGSGIIQPFANVIKDMPNAQIRTRTKFDKFIIDESGKIIGVAIRENYKFDAKLFHDDTQNLEGDKKFIKVKNGVILASGGFSNDKIFRQVQNPAIVPTTDSTNHPGSSAGAMIEGFKLGAMPILVGQILYSHVKCPDEKGNGIGSPFASGCFTYGMSVNAKTGKRYVNELASRRIVSEAMFNVIGSDENYPIHIMDSDGAAMLKDGVLERTMQSGIVKKFDTLEALAKNYKIEVQPFLNEVERYNSFVKSGKDDDFKKPIEITKGITITKPPFYAMRGTPKLHSTMGGLTINEKAQVLGFDNKPIDGLYAAGEVTGGVWGLSRLGNIGTLSCLAFGMIAGENI